MLNARVAEKQLGLQTQMSADAMLAGFGAQELARDNEYARQLRRGIDTIGLMNSGPYIANETRQFGQTMALAGQIHTISLKRLQCSEGSGNDFKAIGQLFIWSS